MQVAAMSDSGKLASPRECAYGLCVKAISALLGGRLIGLYLMTPGHAH